MTKFKKSIVVVIVLIVAVFALGIVNVYAQDVPPVPDLQPGPWQAEFGALFVVLTFFAGIGSATLTFVKPIFLNRLQEEWQSQPNLYLATVYVIRFFFGGLTIAAFGGVETLYTAAPSLRLIPLADPARDLAVIIGAMALLSLGQEGIYIIWNIGRSLAGLPPMGSVEPSRVRIAAVEVVDAAPACRVWDTPPTT